MFWNQFFLTRMFVEEIHGMCKHCPIVVFHILLGNFYSLLSTTRLYLSIFAFAHRHATHLSILTIAFFHFVPHVLISRKCWSGIG
jgi:hypothetical protein